MNKAIACAAIRTPLISAFLRLVSSMCVILLLAGCIQQEDAEDAAENKKAQEQDAVLRGGVYRYPLMNNPSTLDPVYLQDTYGAPIVSQLFEGLVQFGPYLTVLPALAQTWQVENGGRIYRFFLRPDARFHNGHPVTAEDAIFSLQRLLRVNPAPTILPQLLKIEGATAYRDQQNDEVPGLNRINDHEFTVILIEPHVPFLTALGMYQAAIVPKSEIEESEKDFGRSPVGSGPFRFVSWKIDESIQIDRFAGYYAGDAYLDKILYRIYPGTQIDRALSDFRTGGLEEMPVYGNIRQTLPEGQDPPAQPGTREDDRHAHLGRGCDRDQYPGPSGRRRLGGPPRGTCAYMLSAPSGGWLRDSPCSQVQCPLRTRRTTSGGLRRLGSGVAA